MVFSSVPSRSLAINFIISLLYNARQIKSNAFNFAPCAQNKGMEQKNTELLQFIRQNAQMGTVTLSTLAKMLGEGSMKETVKKQLAEYQFVFDVAGRKLDAGREDAKEVSPMMQTAATAMINLQSLTDKSESHIAEMVIVGSTRGVIEITRRIRDYKDANVDNVNLAFRLLVIEQNNIDDLKHYV